MRIASRIRRGNTPTTKRGPHEKSYFRRDRRPCMPEPKWRLREGGRSVLQSAGDREEIGWCGADQLHEEVSEHRGDGMRRPGCRQETGWRGQDELHQEMCQRRCWNLV